MLVHGELAAPKPDKRGAPSWLCGLLWELRMGILLGEYGAYDVGTHIAT